MVKISAYDLAQRFSGTREIEGTTANPQILAMLKLDQAWPLDDEVPWCSAFINYIAWLLRLPRSKSLRARSWLLIGTPIKEEDARVDSDIVVISRGANSPDASVINAPGHVGFFAGFEGESVIMFGGNQGNQVCLSRFPKSRILGLRRLS